jgi:hypothetical protein
MVIKVPVPIKGSYTTINGEAPLVSTQNNVLGVQRTVVGASQEATKEGTAGTQVQSIDDEPINNNDWTEVRKLKRKLRFALDVPVQNISVKI